MYTPPSYSDTTYLPRRYPVLYLLDGDAHFHSVTGLLQILGAGVNATSRSIRVSGGIVASFLKQARERFGKPGLAGRMPFVGQANTITPGDTTLSMHFNSIVQFNSILETFNASGLRYACKYYPADSHGSVPLIAEYDALRFIFDAYNVSLAQAVERPDYLANHFARASTALGYRIDPPEAMVDLVGRVALGRDSTTAQRLFEMNAAAYPTSSNAHVALGEGLGESGGFFEKAIALRPGGQRAKEMVRQLKGASRSP